MSLSYSPVNIIPVRDSVLHLDEQVSYAAYLGASSITYKEVISTSYSNSQMSFSCNPPSPQTVIDRRVMLKVPVTLIFTGVPAAGTRLLQSGYDAFRAFPLHSVMNNLAVSLNNNKITIESSELVNEMLRAYGEDSEKEFLSTSPIWPDGSQEYSELVLTNMNCLAQFGEKTGVPQRGAFPYTTLTNAVDGVTAVVSATLCEPLMISPLMWAADMGKGLIGVQNMSVQINWESNLSRMWSHAAGANTISNIAVSFGQPSLLFSYFTPPATMEIPKQVEYSYQSTEVYVNELGSSKAPGVQFTMLSSNIQLNTVPDKLLVFVKERRSDRTFATTDAWMSIDAFEMSFANVSGMFSGADKRELWKISRGNGLNLSYPEWSGESLYFTSGGSQVAKHGVSGPLVLKFGKDIALVDPSISIGTPGSFNLQIRVTCTNQNPTRTIFPALYVVPVYAGVITIANGQTIQQTAVLSQNDVLNAQASADADGSIDSDLIAGSGMWSDLQSGFKKALPYIRKARKVGQDVASALPGSEAKVAKAVLDGAEAFGLGKKSKGQGGLLIGGGAKLSRAQLKQALQM